ncbi:pyridoxamine 5'-phosphate oxidase family protein [Gordonia sinesedis]
MGERYQHIAFGAHSVQRQHEVGSVVAYGAALGTPDTGPQQLGTREVRMMSTAFQFHLATVTDAGWPYVQYRSGPAGFVHHLGGNQIGFADFHGNQQFVSTGNLDRDGRVAIFFADYPRKRRLKVFGRGQVIEAADDPELLQRLRTIGEQTIAARCERSIVIEVEAFDWNCARSLVPQYTAEDVQARMQPYIDRIAALQDEVAELRGRLSAG